MREANELSSKQIRTKVENKVGLSLEEYVIRDAVTDHNVVRRLGVELAGVACMPSVDAESRGLPGSDRHRPGFVLASRLSDGPIPRQAERNGILRQFDHEAVFVFWRGSRAGTLLKI